MDITDSTQQNLSIEKAVHFLQRFIEIADVFIFVSGIIFNELEQEKNMPSGGILRQSLRLGMKKKNNIFSFFSVSTMAVRNILACRIAEKDRGFSEISINSPGKYEAILKFVNNALNMACFLFIYLNEKNFLLYVYIITIYYNFNQLRKFLQRLQVFFNRREEEVGEDKVHFLIVIFKIF